MAMVLLMPVTAAFPWFESKDFVDCQNFPNDVCVRWDAALDRNEAIKMKYYAGLEVPRQDHMFVPYEVRFTSKY